MGKHVKRKYLEQLYNQFYIVQEENCKFCSKFDCRFYLQALNLEEEFLKNKFSIENRTHGNWYVVFYKNNNYQITLYPVFKK